MRVAGQPYAGTRVILGGGRDGTSLTPSWFNCGNMTDAARCHLQVGEMVDFSASAANCAMQPAEMQHAPVAAPAPQHGAIRAANAGVGRRRWRCWLSASSVVADDALMDLLVTTGCPAPGRTEWAWAEPANRTTPMRSSKTAPNRCTIWVADRSKITLPTESFCQLSQPIPRL